MCIRDRLIENGDQEGGQIIGSFKARMKGKVCADGDVYKRQTS